ncbi:aminotransferase class I/II-fold pyridoxal phosphate-dependent enzyme [Cerasicoccus arenae]|nr:8-amino-7-oxononanoate synthase [Cerasicoccus arenae]MBK1859506.1 8-amino-7-oxononanoate synthase [Cerasicoccus arenae]
MSSFWGRIEDAINERDASSLRRKLTPRLAESVSIDLSNNDYLRLSRHPEVIAAGQEALALWGGSSSASPLVSGYTAAHAALEEQLAHWAGFSYGLVWNAGYSANQAVLGRLPKRGDLVLADRLIHQSMIDGILRSGVRLQRYRHLDIEHLEHLLAGERDADCNVFVVTESVFSVDGDYPDLKAIAALKDRYDFIWILDEAHAIGWYGEQGSGLAEAMQVAPQVDIMVGTLGKGLGSMGAFTLFHQASLRDYLINFSGEFIYSTYLAPVCAVAASKAVELTTLMSSQRAYWQARSRNFRRQISGAPTGDSPIVPILIGDAARTLSIAQLLSEYGFLVGAIRPPTVPTSSSRLRISLNIEISEADEGRLVSLLKEALV